MKASTVGAKIALVVAWLCACSSGSESGPQGACAQFSNKLRGCGMGVLLTEQTRACEEPNTTSERCEASCLMKASCSDLKSLYCDPMTPVSLENCVLACLPPPFRCQSGELIEPSFKCDGVDDCIDGSDEPASCPRFTCANGEIVPASGKCDGFSDCSDSSDESGCPGFRCSSGERVPASARCDGLTDCVDGSDETDGCPGFQCGSGETVPADFKCDGYPDCTDGSDEASGCPPPFQCSSGELVPPSTKCDGFSDCTDSSDEIGCPPSPIEQVCGTP